MLEYSYTDFVLNSGIKSYNQQVSTAGMGYLILYAHSDIQINDSVLYRTRCQGIVGQVLNIFDCRIKKVTINMFQMVMLIVKNSKTMKSLRYVHV